MARKQREHRRRGEHRGRGRAQLARIEGQRASKHSATLTAPRVDVSPAALRSGELLEELLAAQVLRDARDLRPQPRGQVVASSSRAFESMSLRRSRNLRTAASSSAVIALTSQSATAPPAAAAARRHGRVALGAGALLAHDERAGDDVAEPLVLARDEDRDDADEVEATGASRSGASGCGWRSPGSRRLARRADDAQAVPALARRAAAGEHLERDVVAKKKTKKTTA